MTHKQRIAAGIAVVTFLAAVPAKEAPARGVSPYLPLSLSPEIERDIERVLIIANKPILARPIAAATVNDALPKACEVDAALCGRVQRYLNNYMHGTALTHATVEGGATRDTVKAIPNRYGLSSDSPWSAALAGFLQPIDYALLSVGGVAYDGDAVASGTYLSIGFEYAQLDVGYREHWLSPMTDSSMLISTQALTMPSFTLSNYTPIGGWGLRYETFLAEMSRQEGIMHESGPTAGEPDLFGLHASIEPASGFALGVSRLMQYGGGARDGSSVSDIFDAFFRPAEVDNASTPETETFGNQVASFTSRLLIPGRTPFAVYFEYAGEDTSNSESWVLGNAALSAGIHFPRLWNRFDFTYEASDWQNGWYVNEIYPEGLVNEAHIIGHWAGDDRQPGDAVGGQSHMVRIGWESAAGSLLQFRYRTLANETYSGVNYERAHDFTLGYSHPWRPYYVGAEVQFGRDVFGEDFGRLTGFVRYANSSGRIRPPDTSDSAADAGVDVFFDTGINAGRVRQDILESDMTTNTDVELAPHFGVGARRAVSDTSDIGARIELDEFDGESFLAVRAIDYRYRFANRFALTGFLGAARYDLATAAYGYYMGIGGQWRNVAKHWDLSLDLRYGHKVARDRLLPDEPVGPRPDSFFDIFGATLYLSYRL